MQPNCRKEHREKTVNSVLVFYVSNSEVNSRSIDFQIVYIFKQQFKNLSTNHTKYNLTIGHNLYGILRDDGHFAEERKLRTFTTKINE